MGVGNQSVTVGSVEHARESLSTHGRYQVYKPGYRGSYDHWSAVWDACAGNIAFAWLLSAPGVSARLVGVHNTRRARVRHSKLGCFGRTDAAKTCRLKHMLVSRPNLSTPSTTCYLYIPPRQHMTLEDDVEQTDGWQAGGGKPEMLSRLS